MIHCRRNCNIPVGESQYSKKGEINFGCFFFMDLRDSELFQKFSELPEYGLWETPGETTKS